MIAVKVEADAVQPGDIVDGIRVVMVFPGSPLNYTTLIMDDHTLRHYKPHTEIEVLR